MGTLELAVSSRGGRARILVHRTFAEPWMGRALLGGPEAFAAAIEGGAEGSAEESGASIVVVDADLRRAVARASAVFTDDDDDDALVEAHREIASGLWACWDWVLGFAPLERAAVPRRWPEPRLGSLPATAAGALWARLGEWRPLRASFPEEVHVAALRRRVAAHDLGVVTRDGWPLLVRGGASDAPPRELCFAVGSAVASGRLALPSFELAEPEAWLVDATVAPDWTLLATAPDDLVDQLRARNRLSFAENYENLVAALEDELARRSGRPDPWARLAALDDGARGEVIAAVARLMGDAGLADRRWP